MKNEWDRLKKEHPAIEIDSQMQEAHDSNYATPQDLDRIKKENRGWVYIDAPEIDNEMQEAHDSIDNVSDGSTASYYELPDHASELQHLISHKNMNAQMGEIFRSCYRYGSASHSDQLRDAKKIKFYIDAEIERLNNWS